MKRLKLICFYFALTIGLYAQNGVLKFQSTNHDFGIIDTQIQGNLITCSFPFVNIGDDPVIINKVSASTSRIQVDYPNSPIQPNGEGVITVKYDLSSEISSMLQNNQLIKTFRKPIIVLSNAKQSRTSIRISGKVKANMPKEQKITEKDGTIWYRIFRDGKFGAKDINGNEIIPAEYKEVSYYYHDGEYISRGFKVIDNNFCEGFYNITGKNVIPISRGYSHVYKISNKKFGTYYQFKKDNIAGFCDINGKEVIQIPFSCEECSINPYYDNGKFYVKYIHTIENMMRNMLTGDYIVDYLLDTSTRVTSGIIDGNGNTIVEPVNGLIILNKETSFFEYYSDEENKTVSCGKLSDIKTTRNPLANNPVE